MAAFLGKAASSRSMIQLRGVLLDQLGDIVGASAYGMYMFDPLLRPRESHTSGVPDRLLLQYDEGGRDLDLVLDTAAMSSLPSHSLQGRTVDEWHRCALYCHMVSPFDFEHLMVGPLLGDGRTVGSLHFARRKHERPFDDHDLRRITVVCAHVSALMARFSPAADGELASLTPRESEIATLVAAGLNNLEIARCLDISRNTVKEFLKRAFLKLDVDSRAELAARVSASR